VPHHPSKITFVFFIHPFLVPFNAHRPSEPIEAGRSLVARSKMAFCKSLPPFSLLSSHCSTYDSAGLSPAIIHALSIDPANIHKMSNTHSTAALAIAAAATENSCCQHQSGKTITAANGHNP